MTHPYISVVVLFKNPERLVEPFNLPGELPGSIIPGEKNYAADVFIFGTTIYSKCARESLYEEALELGLVRALLLITL